jgi:tetratricopeptide (TPR) repeat protein
LADNRLALPLVLLAVFVLIVAAGCQTGLSRGDAARVYYNVGNAYLDLGKADLAAEYYGKAIKMDKSLREPNYNLARAYIEQNLFDEARGILSLLLEDDPDNTLVLETFGFLYYKKGDYPLARSYYDQVLMLDPGDKSSLLNAGIVAEHQKEDAAAYDYYIRLYTLEPEGPVVKRLGILAGRLDRREDEKLYLEAYLTKNGTDSETLVLLRDIYIEEQSYLLAIEKTDQLITSAPDDKKGLHWFEKGRIFMIHVQDYQKGLEAVSKALELGFADKAAVKELMGQVDPQASGSLADLFKPKGLWP